MKINDILTEISQLPPGAYSGGKSSLSTVSAAKKYFELPGGSGLLYSIENMPNPIIKIWDPAQQQPAVGPEPKKGPYEATWEYYERLEKWEQRQLNARKRALRPGQKTQPMPVAQLMLNAEPFPIAGALQVDAITVDEDYRGRGLARAMYGIVLTVMRRPLLAGTSQTPGGQKNWVSLYNIPGVEIHGYTMIDNYELDEHTDDIMGRMGGDYMGARNGYHFFKFDVGPTTTGAKLETWVKNTAIKVYGEEYDSAVGGLYAVWTGQ